MEGYRWIYIVLVIVVISVLRYIGYKRAQRVEKKLDLIMGALGVEYKDEEDEKNLTASTDKLNSQNDIDVVDVDVDVDSSPWKAER